MGAGPAPHLKAVGTKAGERTLQTLAEQAGERIEPEAPGPSGPPPGLTPPARAGERHVSVVRGDDGSPTHLVLRGAGERAGVSA